jgi:hypothetical protein
MLDLANLGTPPPITDGMSEKERLLANYNFDCRRRPSDEDLEKFKRRWQKKLYVYEKDDELVELRDAVRGVFQHGGGEAEHFLSQWGAARIRRGGMTRLLVIRLHGFNLPLPQIELRQVIAMAVLDVLPKMTRCGHPGCPAPYFLRVHRTTRFCDRPACIQYGQRIHKLNWWRKHGEARRAKLRQKKVTTESTKGGKR